MQILKNIFQIYIKTSIHIGIAVLSLAQITAKYFNINFKSQIAYFVLFGTILAYNFLKYNKAFYKKSIFGKQNLAIKIVTFIAFMGAVYSFFQLNNTTQIQFSILGILVLLYPFIRKIGLLKMLFVSFCITFCTVLIPSLESGIVLQNTYILLIQRILIIFCLLIPFEILDLKADNIALKTIPQVFGINATKKLGLILLLLFLTLNYFHFELQKFICEAIITITTCLFILFSNINRNSNYTAFWVESVPIFWYLLLKNFI